MACSICERQHEGVSYTCTIAVFPDAPASPGRAAALSWIPEKKDTQRQAPKPIQSTWVPWAGNQPWLLNPLTSETLTLFLLQHYLTRANKYSRNINSATLTKKHILTIYIRSLKISWHYWLQDSLPWHYVSRGSQQYNPWCWKLEASQMTKIRRMIE